jgi:hypothetical protein
MPNTGAGGTAAKRSSNDCFVRPDAISAAILVSEGFDSGGAEMAVVAEQIWSQRRSAANVTCRQSSALSAACPRDVLEDGPPQDDRRSSTPTRGQFTSAAFTDKLEGAGVRISMGGCGAA